MGELKYTAKQAMDLLKIPAERLAEVFGKIAKRFIKQKAAALRRGCLFLHVKPHIYNTDMAH